MLKLKPKILLLATLICTLISFTSCSNEDNTVIEENLVISEMNLELLKTRALISFENNDFSKIIKPAVNTTNYLGIIDVLNNIQNRDATAKIINFQDYTDILGEYYDEEYFNQLEVLFDFAIDLVQSDLFNKNSTIKERESYLIDVLEFVILDSINNNLANRSSNCREHRTVCENGA